MNDAILELKGEFVAEVLDVAAVHLQWTSRHLQEGRHDKAIMAFQKMLAAVREAAAEMVAIRTVLDGQKVTGGSAAEWRGEQASARRRLSEALA